MTSSSIGKVCPHVFELTDAFVLVSIGVFLPYRKISEQVAVCILHMAERVYTHLKKSFSINKFGNILPDIGCEQIGIYGIKVCII